MASSGAHGDSEDDPAPNDYLHDNADPSQFASAQETPSTDPKSTPQSLPLQKRRRVGRACDECRRKKIKCDGKQPCTHCTVYSYGAPFPRPFLLFSLAPLLPSPHVANVLKNVRTTNPLTAVAIPPRSMSRHWKPACKRPRLCSGWFYRISISMTRISM